MAKHPVTFNINRVVMDKFREVCKQQGFKMSKIIENKIKDWLNSNGVEIK